MKRVLCGDHFVQQYDITGIKLCLKYSLCYMTWSLLSAYIDLIHRDQRYESLFPVAGYYYPDEGRG